MMRKTKNKTNKPTKEQNNNSNNTNCNEKVMLVNKHQEKQLLTTC